MTNDNSGEIGSPSRRSWLKAAAAAGAFAVPLIASFSMDTASAQTTSKAMLSSNQVISSNMFCANMTSFPTSVFYADLQRVNESGDPVGVAAGIANLQLVEGLDEFYYEFLIQGTVAYFRLYLDAGESFIEVYGGPQTGTINASSLNCGPNSLGTLYSALATGGSCIDVDLRDGHKLRGTFYPQIYDGAAPNRLSHGLQG